MAGKHTPRDVMYTCHFQFAMPTRLCCVHLLICGHILYTWAHVVTYVVRRSYMGILALDVIASKREK